MKVRFGYVAIALNIENGSPNKTVTVKTIEKITDTEAKLNRLRRALRENLEITLRILRYNVAHQIHLYRFTSKTVPLATHPLTNTWQYIEEFAAQWHEIGRYIKDNNLRVSAHPDHYTLINSPKVEVLLASLKDLNYHATIFDALELEISPQLVMHIGGLYQNREESINRFKTNFKQLPDNIKYRLMLENDDKSYCAADVLEICQELTCPMVLDIHHHACFNRSERLSELWLDIAKTWKTNIPKIHLSSPKSTKDFRSHADYINIQDFLPFLYAAKEINLNFDVMIEAKQKDAAMFRLLNELENIKGINRIDATTIEI